MANRSINSWDRIRTKIWAQCCADKLKKSDAAGVVACLDVSREKKHETVRTWGEYLGGSVRPFKETTVPVPKAHWPEKLRETCPEAWDWFATPFWFLLDREVSDHKVVALTAEQLRSCALLLPASMQAELLYHPELKVLADQTKSEEHEVPAEDRPWTVAELLANRDRSLESGSGVKRSSKSKVITRSPWMCFQSLAEPWLYALTTPLGPYSLAATAWALRRAECTGQYDLMRWAAVGLCWQLTALAESELQASIQQHLLSARALILIEFKDVIYYDGSLAPIQPLDEALFGEMQRLYLETMQDLVDENGDSRWPPDDDYQALKLATRRKVLETLYVPS